MLISLLIMDWKAAYLCCMERFELLCMGLMVVVGFSVYFEIVFVVNFGYGDI